jgi:hypothetical protein
MEQDTERILTAWERFRATMRSLRERRLRIIENFINKRNEEKQRAVRDSLNTYDRD